MFWWFLPTLLSNFEKEEFVLLMLLHFSRCSSGRYKIRKKKLRFINWEFIEAETLDEPGMCMRKVLKEILSFRSGS